MPCFMGWREYILFYQACRYMRVFVCPHIQEVVSCTLFLLEHHKEKCPIQLVVLNSNLNYD
jgi:hypothetical protein